VVFRGDGTFALGGTGGERYWTPRDGRLLIAGEDDRANVAAELAESRGCGSGERWPHFLFLGSGSMKHHATRWWLGAAFGMTILAGPTHSAAPLRVEQAVRPTPGAIADWEEAGAVFGWLSIDLNGDWRFDEGEPAAWPAFRDMGFGPREPAVGPWPAFRFNKLPAGKVERLALPHVPFGLWLGRSVKDADLKALGGLTQLRALGLSETKVTDTGLMELTGLKGLELLCLPGQVTDAGIATLQTALPLATIAASRPPYTCRIREWLPIRHSLTPSFVGIRSLETEKCQSER
jgi:hypothetical protein